MSEPLTANLRWSTDDPVSSFTWTCPDCGHKGGCILGSEPVSGWENPRWVNTGTVDRPTLTPSLGCGWCMRDGTGGHFWLRDGELVRA